MSDLPDIYEMDPDDWYDEVQRHARELREAVREALDTSESLEELRDALQPHIQPFIVDPDDPVHAEQILAEIKYGEKLCVGVKHGDWLELTYRDDQGFWWFDNAEPRRGDQPVERLHDHIAHRVVSATNWGDEQLARQRTNEQKKHRELGEDYLEALQTALQQDGATAAELREAFHRLINGCLDPDAEVVVADVSPDDHHTRVRLRHDGELFGELLAVDVGAPVDADTICESMDISRQDYYRFGTVTDHRHFVWPALGEHAGPITLKLPSEKSENPGEYHRAIDWVVRHLREALTPPEPED